MSDHTLVADEPARVWTEAYPLGNGRLGAMCFGDPERDRFQLNHDTAWSGNADREYIGGAVSSDRAADALARARAAMRAGDQVTADRLVRRLQQRYAQAYLPLAALDLVAFGNETPPRMRRELDLARGEHRLDARWSRRRLRRSAVTSISDGVLAVSSVWEGGRGGFVVELTSPLQELERHRTAEGLEVVLAAPVDVAPTHAPEGEGERQRAGGRGSVGEGERQRAGGRGSVEPTVRWTDDHTRVVRLVVAVHLDHDGEPVEHRLGTVHATEAMLSLAVESTFRGLGLAPDTDLAGTRRLVRGALASARRQDPETRRRTHLAEHARLYDRVRLMLPTTDEIPAHRLADARPSPVGPDVTADRLETARVGGRNPVGHDPSLVALAFHYGRYLLAASSRPGTLPANLQGIWNDQMQPSWSSNYTVNINTQMNYWGAEVGNLAECHLPLFDLIDAIADRGRDVAARLYASRGWAAHHNVDAWAHVSPVGLGTANPAWAFWPMAGPWLVQHLREHLAFGGDLDLAERAWPAVRGTVAFCLDQLEEIEPGVWAPLLSTSPENEFVVDDGGTAAVGRASSMDLELVRAAIEFILELADHLGRDDEVVDQARVVLPTLPLPRIAGDGSFAEWWDDHPAVDPHHRHLSMLYGLAPGTRRLDPSERAAAAVALDRRGDDGSGWSLVWKALLWARLRRGDRVQRLLGLLFRDARRSSGEWSGGVYPNLFAAHPPFQIDANLGLVRVVAECLVQWSPGYLTLLPALPPAWHTGSVHGLVVPPGACLDVVWEEGDVVRARLVPFRDGEVDVEIAGVRSVVTLDRDVPVTWTDDDPAWRAVGEGERQRAGGRWPA